MTIDERLDHIEQEIIEIKGMLQTLIEQTAPPPSIKTKMRLDARANQAIADRAERKRRREENRLKKQKLTD